MIKEMDEERNENFEKDIGEIVSEVIKMSNVAKKLVDDAGIQQDIIERFHDCIQKFRDDEKLDKGILSILLLHSIVGLKVHDHIDKLSVVDKISDVLMKKIGKIDEENWESFVVDATFESEEFIRKNSHFIRKISEMMGKLDEYDLEAKITISYILGYQLGCKDSIERTCDNVEDRYKGIEFG